jgi:hypothetical protein
MPSLSESTYRLSADECVAVAGLSRELRSLVTEGLRAAKASGRLPEGDPIVGFYEELGRVKHRDTDTRYLIGFGAAQPLLRSDRELLGGRLHVDPDRLACPDDPVSLYEVGCFLDDCRDSAGLWRRTLAAGCRDATRVLNVVGMPLVQRKREVTLVKILHAAWRSDSREQAALLAARWPLAVTGEVR